MRVRIPWTISIFPPVFAFIFLPTCPKAKFRNNFHLYESSFTCPRIRPSWLARRLCHILCLSQAKTWISTGLYCGVFCVQWFEVRVLLLVILVELLTITVKLSYFYKYSPLIYNLEKCSMSMYYRVHLTLGECSN